MARSHERSAAPAHRLDVSHSRSDNSEVIACRGWLDSDTCDALQNLIDAALDDRVERLRIDLNDLDGIDDNGRRCLTTTARRCEDSGILLEIEAHRPVLREIFNAGA